MITTITAINQHMKKMILMKIANLITTITTNTHNTIAAMTRVVSSWIHSRLEITTTKIRLRIMNVGQVHSKACL